MTATLFVITAPSGTGKTSLVNAVVAGIDKLKISISHTTRSMRPGEIDGVSYHFVSPERFQAMIAAAAFLEYAKVFDHFYGTSRQFIVEELQQGNDVILEIDWQGAQQVRMLFPESVDIFIVPPSRQALYHRLGTRNQDTKDVIEKRYAKASEEIAHYKEFAYLVMNDNFDRALEDLLAIIRSHRLLQARQTVKLAKELANLLEKS